MSIFKGRAAGGVYRRSSISYEILSRVLVIFVITITKTRNDPICRIDAVKL